MFDAFCDTTPGLRDAGLIRTDIVRRMMNPLDAYPDLFDRVTTSPYRELMRVQSDLPPRVRPALPGPIGAGWAFG